MFFTGQNVFFTGQTSSFPSSSSQLLKKAFSLASRDQIGWAPCSAPALAPSKALPPPPSPFPPVYRRWEGHAS